MRGHFEAIITPHQFRFAQQLPLKGKPFSFSGFGITKPMLSVSFNEEAGFKIKFYEADNKRLRVDVLQCPYDKYYSWAARS